MSKGMSETGYLSDEELDNGPGIPSEGRRRRGPVAVLECIQDIPCNPCESELSGKVLSRWVEDITKSSPSVGREMYRMSILLTRLPWTGYFFSRMKVRRKTFPG